MVSLFWSFLHSPEKLLPIGDFFLWIQLIDILDKITMETYFQNVTNDTLVDKKGDCMKDLIPVQ